MLHEKALINHKKFELDLNIYPQRDTTIGELIKQERIKMDLSQRQLSRLVGCVDIIRKCELGYIKPTRDMSLKLAKIFNTDSTYFYDAYLEETENFPTKIKSLLDSGLGVTDLSRKFKVSRRTIYRWVDGEIPSRRKYERIKELL